MNLKLLFDLKWYVRKPGRHSGIRRRLAVSSKFGSFGSAQFRDELIQKFDAFVREIQSVGLIHNDVEILKINPARARIIVKTQDANGQPVVVKWYDPEAFACFNFKNQMDNEISIHGHVSIAGGQIIPKMLFEGPNYFAVAFVEGGALQSLIKHRIADGQLDFVRQVAKDLKDFYLANPRGDLSPAGFNEMMFFENDYFWQTEAVSIASAFAIAKNAPSDFVSKYQAVTESCYQIIRARRTPWQRHLVFRDLDEQNIIQSRESRQTYIIDVEDVHEGSVVFDMAWFASRLLMFDAPSKHHTELVQILESVLHEIDIEDPESSCQLFRKVLAKHLMALGLNMRLWPEQGGDIASSPANGLDRKLKDIWRLANIYSG